MREACSGDQTSRMVLMSLFETGLTVLTSHRSDSRVFLHLRTLKNVCACR